MKAKVKTWLRNVENGNINGKTEKVLSYIKNHSVNEPNTYELRINLNMAHQTLTSIVSQLQDEGLVKAIDQIEIKGNWYTVYQFVEDQRERDFFIQYREKEKVMTWLKQGIVRFGEHCTPPFQKVLENNLANLKIEVLTESIQLTLF